MRCRAEQQAAPIEPCLHRPACMATAADRGPADEAGVATWCKLGYSARAAEENCLGSPEDDFWNEGRCAAGLPVCPAKELLIADPARMPQDPQNSNIARLTNPGTGKQSAGQHILPKQDNHISNAIGHTASRHWLHMRRRVVVTDHGHFVLINVYVPNAGGKPERPRLATKLDFLRLLKAEADGFLEQGREVGP